VKIQPNKCFIQFYKKRLDNEGWFHTCEILPAQKRRKKEKWHTQGSSNYIMYRITSFEVGVQTIKIDHYNKI
jgi:hypothetical protein